MNDQFIKTNPHFSADIFAVDSGKLKELRMIIHTWKDINQTLGKTAAQFRLVVDSNVILGDIIWLAAKRNNETATTQLMETIEAETIDVYGPPSLFEEVEEKIPLIAAQKG